jgi:quercetin dioxygenase-like cupin family protein
MLKMSLRLAAAAVLTFVSAAAAQEAPYKRLTLQRVDVPGTDYETVIGLADIAPNLSIGRHFHPGIEAGYVLAGELTLLVDGQPPKPLKVGDSYQVPPNAIHDIKAGATPGKFLATYVVKKGEPLATPAP